MEPSNAIPRLPTPLDRRQATLRSEGNRVSSNLSTDVAAALLTVASRSVDRLTAYAVRTRRRMPFELLRACPEVFRDIAGVDVHRSAARPPSRGNSLSITLCSTRAAHRAALVAAHRRKLSAAASGRIDDLQPRNPGQVGSGSVCAVLCHSRASGLLGARGIPESGTLRAAARARVTQTEASMINMNSK